MDSHLLAFGGLPAFEHDMAAGNVEQLGQVGDKMFIGPAPNRRGREADFQAVAYDAGDSI